MHIRRARPNSAVVERYVEELWLPYHRNLSDTVTSHELVEVDGLLETVTEFTIDLLESPETYIWVAIEDADDGDTDLATTDGAFCGFLLGVVEPSPSHFEAHDTFVVGDVYVCDSHRGAGLADRLVDRAGEQAREDGCAELALDVELDNERAIAFYEKRGFEPTRQRMHVSVSEL